MENINVLAYSCTYCTLCVSSIGSDALTREYGRATDSDIHSFFNNGAAGAAPVFAQFLKDSKNPKYSISQINDYPTTTYAVQIITTFIYAWASDSGLNGDRLSPIVCGGVYFPASSSLHLITHRLILVLRSSTSSAIPLSPSGIFQRVGDGHAISYQVQAMAYLVSAWRM